MRREELYLRDIVEAADAVQRFVSDVDEETFLADELRQSAVLQKLIVIGEAAARIDRSFRAQFPDVPWTDIVGFRNIAVHAYFSVPPEPPFTTSFVDSSPPPPTPAPPPVKIAPSPPKSAARARPATPPATPSQSRSPAPLKAPPR